MTKPVDKDSLPLDKPRRTPGHPTKSHIVKTKVDGKEKIIRFGEQGAETAGKPKAGESDRMKQKRASFKARHAKNIAKGKSSPAWWAAKIKWADGGAVGRGMENVSELWRSYLPSDLSDRDFSDLNQRLQYRPLNVKRLLESGAIRITDPAGDPSGEGWSLVTGWNDKYPESSTPKWADRPGAYASAMQALNQPGPLYDGKYRQVLWSAMRAGLRPEDVFLEQPEGYARGGAVKLAGGGSAALALIEQMRRAGAQTQEFDPVLVSMRDQRARPARRPQMPAQAAAPLAAMRVPQPREEPLPLPPTPPAMRPDENPPPEAPRNPMRFDEGNPHVATAIRMAERYGLPPSIFLSLVQQESRFNPTAVSSRGAIGLGQLMPATARELNVDPRDPEQNLEGSARYLRRMLDQFGNMELALAAYNAGPGRVRQAGNTIPNIRETQEYVPSVLRRAGASTGPEYAEGGEVRTPEEEEYDRRLLSRMKAQTGRVTEPTRAEQMQALRTAGREAAEGLADVLLPQSPLDLALMAAFGPGGRAARLAGSAALASLEPSEAEASRLRRLIRAYHGSPHKFDEFDIRKIGTGEGAQAYGRGLYFAEDEDVAKYYRDKLAPFRQSDVKDVRAAISDREAALVRALDDQAQINLQVQSGRLLPNALRNAENDVARARYDLDIQQRRFADMNDSFGHMYEVNLNAAPRDFLNWDEPLSQQSRGVQESLQRFGLRADPDAARAYDDALLDALYNDPGRALPPQPRDPTGQEIYQRALRMDPEEARIALMRAGIPGTRYLDAGSRGVGGTYNYAVFDPEIIDITRRYAEGGLAQLDQKYAEGGVVRSEAATYDPDAVDALVKQIEAEYV